MSNLTSKSIHELRAIAQRYGIADLFSKDAIQLQQSIDLKKQEMIPEPPIVIAQPMYDARLMTKVPQRKTNEDDIRDLLKPLMDKGMHLSFPNHEEWHMQFGIREDTGTVRMPLRNVLRCADYVMSGKR